MRPIRFFSLQDNQPVSPSAKAKKVPKATLSTGYISTTGKLVFPSKTVQTLSTSGPVQAMRVGSPAGTRKLDTLYLIPTDTTDASGFPLLAAAKRSTIDLAQILRSEHINYSKQKYRFTLTPFVYQDSQHGYELRLTVQSDKPKAPYAGKRRGRKPRMVTSPS